MEFGICNEKILRHAQKRDTSFVKENPRYQAYEQLARSGVPPFQRGWVDCGADWVGGFDS